MLTTAAHCPGAQPIIGLEGMAWTRMDRSYRAEHRSDWVKVKKPLSPAMTRADHFDLSKKR
jgi:hypothetical protein